MIGPFYMLMIALAGTPPYALRVEGGYDSCRLIENAMHKYAAQPIATECLTNVEWKARGYPGK